MAKRTRIPKDTLTYLNLVNIGICIDEILGQYSLGWMPVEIDKVYRRMKKDAERLTILAEKAANVEYED